MKDFLEYQKKLEEEKVLFNIEQAHKFTVEMQLEAKKYAKLAELAFNNELDVIKDSLREKWLFLSYPVEGANKWDGDIITNPPYKASLGFVKHALDIVENGRKVIMFLKLTFLEGVERGEFFKTNPPKKVLVFSKRIMCAKNGNFEEMKAGGGSAVAYAWFVWEKGFQGKPEIEWI